jgi:hypothetical protein
VRKDNEPAVTAWKEAGVGMVAVYESPVDPATEHAHRVDARYFARMPEPKMRGLVADVINQTQVALQNTSFHHKVFIADGKPEIWRTVNAEPLFNDFTPVLDFYHAAEHLSHVSEALFGKSTRDGNLWYRRWRHKLIHETNAIHALLRSLTRYRTDLRKGTARYDIVDREIRYYRTNRWKMDYAVYRAQHLPISSGPIEAACKTLVGSRLKQSGMRWTRRGGQQILNLRAPLRSNRWEALWSWYLHHTDQIATAA